MLIAATTMEIAPIAPRTNRSILVVSFMASSSSVRLEVRKPISLIFCCTFCTLSISSTFTITCSYSLDLRLLEEVFPSDWLSSHFFFSFCRFSSSLIGIMILQLLFPSAGNVPTASTLIGLIVLSAFLVP